MIIIIVILIVFLIVLSFISINLFRKNEVMEDRLEEEMSINDDLLGFIMEMNNRLSTDYLMLKEVDQRGSFEADDEVGFIFQTILNTVEDSAVFIRKKIKLIDVEGDQEEEGEEKEE